MRVAFASTPAPGQVNEDYVAAGAGWALVLDGATAPAGVDSGCSHGVAWLARRLGAALGLRLAVSRRPLAELLADAIVAVRAEHGGGCDLANPDSPSATAAMLRVDQERLEYLTLGDSPVLLGGRDGAATVVLDDRVDHLASYTAAAVTAARNAPGGFWVAAADPEAAGQALTGAVVVDGLRCAALLTDGATRYVQRFAAGDWADMLRLMERQGPDGLIQRVRAAESAEPVGARAGKRHDDATAVMVQW